MLIEKTEIIGYSIAGYDVCLDCLTEIKGQIKPKKTEAENEAVEANNEKEEDSEDEDDSREEVLAALAAGETAIILTKEDTEEERSLICDICNRLLIMD